MNDHFSPPEPGRATILALHGRGGCERQLLALCRAADRALGILVPRGEVAAGDGYSWSRRHGVGVPCPLDLRARAGALGRWLDRALPALGVDGPLCLVGYSNGAIMAAALAALRPDLVRALALLRGAYPLPWLRSETGPRGMPILASAGEDDHVLPAGGFSHGLRIYRTAGARVESVSYASASHGLCLADARALRAWLAPRCSVGHLGGDRATTLAATAWARS